MPTHTPLSPPVARPRAAAAPPRPAAQPAAAAEDARAIDALIAELYAVISGPPGERDWDRFRALFAPEARLMPSRATERGIVLEVLDPEGYAASRGPIFRQSAFYEREVGRKLAVCGDVAHAWSSYEGRFALDGPVALAGVNSIQLHRDRSGWRIVSLLWNTGRAPRPTPGGLS